MKQVIADTLSAIFRQNGYTVLTAYDGKSALETAKVIPPELLISDVMMPEMSGVDLAIALRHSLPECEDPFVFRTGGDDGPASRRAPDGT